MKHTEIKPVYDVVIIGSGVGGLTAGALLSKAGMSVCVLEKEPHPGGYLAGFRRKDFRFDTAIHWLNQYNEQGMITRLFAALGNDFPRALQQDRIRRYIGDDHEYVLTSNPDDLKNQWLQEFPEDAAGIERFFAAAKGIGWAFANFGHIFRSEETMGFWEKMGNKRNLLRFAMKFIPHLRYSGDKGMQKGLAKYFTNEKLKKVFSSDTEILSCLVPVGWAYYGDYQSPPHGGGQVIPEWLEHMIEYYKQDIHYRCTVKQVITHDNKAGGVVCTRNGKEFNIQSKYVIAACDAPLLFNKLLPKGLVPQKTLNNLDKAELYSSSVTVSIGLDCPVEELGFNEEMIHISSARVARKDHTCGDPDISEIVILAPSYRDKSLAPAGNGTLVLFMPAFMNFEENWRTEKDEHGNLVRGEAYKQLKEETARRIIDRVAKRLAPNLRDHILFYDVATPVTHWRYTGNTDGSMMGAKPGRANMMNKVAGYRTPVKNLLLGGHWAELGGGVPIAAKAGANAALLILKKEKKKAFTALADYMDGKITAAQLAATGALQPYNGHWHQKPTPAQKKAAREQAQAGTE